MIFWWGRRVDTDIRGGGFETRIRPDRAVVLRTFEDATVWRIEDADGDI